MPGISLWAATAAQKLYDLNNEPLLNYEADGFTFSVNLLDDSLWVTVTWHKNCRAGFRTAFSPNGLAVQSVTKIDEGTLIALRSETGEYEVTISFPQSKHALLHYTVKIKPAYNLFIPFWPKDVLVAGKTGNPNNSAGEVYIRQEGIRTGLMYVGSTKPDSGSFLYFQNLTAINDYCTVTETSVANTVGGNWPEFGFSLPVTKENPLPAGQQITIADAYVSFSPETPEDQFAIATGFLGHLAAIYLLLPKPETQYIDYPPILQNALHDIIDNKGCWSQHKGCSYLNAYVCDYTTPPEIMVQLAVLLPLRDYMDWSGEELLCANQLHDNIPTFYSEKLKTIKRWLPAAEDKLDNSEEQKAPNVMDAWYLHHPLLNLGRMALQGDEMAKGLFLRSVDYAIKVARHFNYRWPVFYDMETLEVLKEETQPGMGGEKDVAGVYAQVMLQAWDITGEKRFFNEAQTAAKSLTQYGFHIFYQANNTTFSTKAMLRLYKETRDELYLNLCYLLIANLMKNVALWDCNYGYGKNFPGFFGLFPLNDAPYLAVYEEQESLAAMHDLLAMTVDINIDFNEPARMLLAEYIKYMINRAVYYFPPMLPKDMLADEVKTGEIDPKLWVALEDMHDGWEKAGTVGQEVYGAGLCFGIVPRHYIRIPGKEFMVYTEYPIANVKIKGNTLTLMVLGVQCLTSRLCIVPVADKPLPEISLQADNAEDQQNAEKVKVRKGPLSYTVHGNQTIKIKWG